MKKEGSRSRKGRELLTEEQTKRVEGKETERGWRNQRREKEGKEREKRRKGRKCEVTWERKVPSRWKVIEGIEVEKVVSRKELERKREVERKGDQGSKKERRRKLEKEVKERGKRVVEKRERKVEEGKAKEGKPSRGKESRKEWKEQVVRVGTGYRVRKHEKKPGTRRFDVGYGDRKEYTRKPGREAIVDQSSMGRRVVGKGEDARVKVMNAVCGMEKRRPASEYTGSGIRRKSEVGKRKLKPTKPQAKQ